MESVETIIEFWAAKDPRAEACRDCVRSGLSRSLTYGDIKDEYQRIASNIACLITALDLDPRSKRPVAVCMTRGSYWYSTFIALVSLRIPVVPMTQDIADEAVMEIRNTMILSSLAPIFVISDSTTPLFVQNACALSGVPVYDISNFVSQSTPLSAPKRLRDISSVPLAYLYTGGTTSGCKCVQVSHGMAMHEMGSYPRLIPENSSTREIVLQHSSTYWGATFLGQINIALAIGGCVVFSDNVTDLSPIIDSQKITIIGLVPSQLGALSGPCPTLRTIFTWGEKLPQAVAKKRVSNTTQVIELLVSTEYWLSLYAMNGSEDFEVLISPNVDIKISSDGELLVGGDCVTPFGYTDEGLNSTSFTIIDKKRFFKTKDLVRMENGKLRFAGRADNLIKIGGEWRDLHCIETELRSIETVEDVAILPPKSTGYKPAVFVVISGPMKRFPEIRRIVNQEYIRLVFVHKLPRHLVTGKIDRQALMAHIELPMTVGDSKSRRISACLIWFILTFIFASYLVFLNSIFALVLFPYIVLFFLCIPRKKFPQISSMINWPSNLIGHVFWPSVILIISPTYVSTCIGLAGLWVRRDVWWPIVFWFGIPRQIERWIQSLSPTKKTLVRNGGETKGEKNRVDRSWLDRGPEYKNFTCIEIFDYEIDEIFQKMRQNGNEEKLNFNFETKSISSPLYTPLIEILEKICDMLPLPISVSTNLSGLSSLVAVMLARSIRDSLGRKIAVSDILKCDSVGDLVACIESAEVLTKQVSSLSTTTLEIDPTSTSYRCQMWGWGLPCMWLFEAPGGSSIHYKSLREALGIMAERHAAFRAMPVDPNPLWYWMNDVFVTFGLIKWMSPDWLSSVLTFTGSKVFSSSCRITRRRDTKKFYLGWNDTVFRSRADLRAYLNKGFHPPITAEILTLEEPSAGDSKRHFVRLFLTHAFSDGSSVVPILAELNLLYEGILKGEKEMGKRPPPADGLRIQESRLHAALTSKVPTEDDLYLCYNIDSSRDLVDGFGETIIMEQSFVAVCHAASAKMGCSIDVLFLSGIVCALARLDDSKRPRIVPLSLIVPLRDSPGDASEAVGFLADLRNMEVVIGSSDLASLLSVVQSVIEIRRGRKWTIPDPFSSCERVLINIVPAANVGGEKFFKQELCLQQTPGRTFVAHMPRPMELYLEQISRMRWTFRARCRLSEWSEEKFSNFVQLFKEAIVGILVDPNQLL